MSTTTISKWRIYCTTDSQFEYTWQAAAPTVCPVNGGHGVINDSVSQLESIKVFTITNADSPYTVMDRSVLCDTTSGNITINLNKSVKTKDARFMIKKIAAANTVTIDPYGSEQINAGSTLVLSANNEMKVIESDGSNWSVVGTGSVISELDTKNEVMLTTDKGDMLVDDGSLLDVLNVGTNNYALIADSTEATGVKWAQVDHTTLSNIGTNTHAQIDTHISASTAHGVSGTLVGTSDTQTLTNKTINSDNNTITNIVNADIKAGAAIDAAKIADGSVSNTEFQYLGTVTSDVQTQLGTKVEDVTNVGDGIPIYKQKTGVNLELKQMTGTSTIAVSSTPVANAYEFENDVTDTMSIQNGTIAGGVTYATGKVGSNCAHFDGVSGTKVNIGALDVPNTSAFSISCWFKVDVFSDARLVTKADGTSIGDHVFSLGVASASSIAFRLTTGTLGTGTELAATVSLSTGTWYHMIGWYDGANYKLYLDGTEEATAAKTGTVPKSDTINTSIGNQPPGGGGDRVFDGKMDQVVFWDKALTSGEISDLYNGGSGRDLSYFAEDDISFKVIESGLALNSISGTLNVEKGGTGVTTLTSGNFLQGNGTSAITATKAVPSGVVVGTTDTQTLTNKTLTSAVLTTPEINDTSADHQYVFGVSELTADRTVTLPLLTGNDTFVFEAHTQTLTNKTLTAPVISTISNTGTLTLPTSTDTLVGRATTDTLTNKTLTSPVLTTPQINDTSLDHQYVFGVSELTVDRTVTLPLLTGNDTFVFEAHTQTLTNKTLTAPVISTISNTGTLTLPTSTDTLVGRATTDTLTNKTLTSPVLTTPQINDTSSDHQYVFGVSELTLDRTVTLPLLTGNDTFVFEAHTQTLTNKTINTASNTLTIATGDVTSGTFADARISQSSVTQHQAAIDHGSIAGLGDDDHTQYALLAGRSGGQTLIGGTASGNDITIKSTSHATKGSIKLDDPVIANDVGYSTTYPLSVQGSTANTYLEILNSTGSGEGSFFGQQGDEFALYNWQGGNIIFYTSTTPSSGSIRFTIQDNGNVRVHNLGTGVVKSGSTGILSSESTNTAFNKNFGTSAGTVTEGDHVGTATGVHGVTGNVVGTTDTQTLTNKTMGDNLNLNSNKIINLATPTADTDGATKAYVDSVANGLDVKDSVVAASTVDLDSNGSISGTATYNATAGTSGRGQITATLVTTDTFTVDGVTFAAADDGSRVLLKDQSAGAENGIWTTTVSGTSLTLDRATDFDADSEVTSGAFMFVEEGTTNADNGFTLTTNDPIVIGGSSGTALTFSQFSGAGQITAGTGMTKSGNTIDAVGSTTIIANADDLEVNSSNTANQILLSSGSAGTAATFGALPLANTDAVSGVLGIANGGTNASSFTTGSRLIGTNSGNTALETTELSPSNVVTLAGTQTLSNKTLTAPQINDTSSDHQYVYGVSELTADRTVTLPLLTGNDTFVFEAFAQTLTNKTINADNNTITNIDNADIKAAAAIDATKIADGTVSNTEFQYLNSVTSDIQNQFDTHTHSAAAGWTDDGTTVRLTTSTDKVGIGNASPDGFFEVRKVTAGSGNHVRFTVYDTANVDTYNLGLDTGDSSGIVASTEDGTYRQAMVFAADATATGTIFGVAGSSDSGSSWDPKFVIHQDGMIGVGKNNPSDTFDVSGNIVVSGTVDGRDVAADGTAQDSHIAASTGIHGISGAVVGTTDTQTLTNKTLTSPKVGTSILDTNGNELYVLTATASAVNEITLANAATGNGPSLTASGTDTNIDFNITPKGSGNVVLDGLKWPNADGTSNQVLKTDGAGNIGYADVEIATLDDVTTTDATLTTMATIATSSDTTYVLNITVAARRTDAGSESAGYVFKALYRNNTGTLTKVKEDRTAMEDSNQWNATLGVSGTNIILQVVGQAAKTISWVSSCKILSV